MCLLCAICCFSVLSPGTSVAWVRQVELGGMQEIWVSPRDLLSRGPRGEPIFSACTIIILTGVDEIYLLVFGRAANRVGRVWIEAAYSAACIRLYRLGPRLLPISSREARCPVRELAKDFLPLFALALRQILVNGTVARARYPLQSGAFVAQGRPPIRSAEASASRSINPEPGSSLLSPALVGPAV